MLVKEKIENEQKYVKLNELSLEEFLNAAFTKFSISPINVGVKLFDDTGTEVDSEVSEELLQQPSIGVVNMYSKNLNFL